jgi:hypothetical protein
VRISLGGEAHPLISLHTTFTGRWANPLLVAVDHLSYHKKKKKKKRRKNGTLTLRFDSIRWNFAPTLYILNRVNPLASSMDCKYRVPFGAGSPLIHDRLNVVTFECQEAFILARCKDDYPINPAHLLQCTQLLWHSTQSLCLQ